MHFLQTFANLTLLAVEALQNILLFRGPPLPTREPPPTKLSGVSIYQDTLFQETDRESHGLSQGNLKIIILYYLNILFRFLPSYWAVRSSFFKFRAKFF